MKKVLFVIILFFVCMHTYYADEMASAGVCYSPNYYNFNFLKEYEGNDNETTAKFSIFSIDKTSEIVLSEINNIYDIAKEAEEPITEQNAAKAKEYNYYLRYLTSSQREWLNSINSFSDLNSYYETGNYTFNYDDKVSFLQNIKNSNGISIVNLINTDNNKYAYVYILSFGLLEETETPEGYGKEKAIVPYSIEFEYAKGTLNFNGIKPIGFISKDEGGCSGVYYNSFLLKYSKDIDYDNVYEAINKMNDSYVISNNCNIPFTLGNVYGYENNNFDYVKDGTCKSVITNKKGTPSIVATGSLNDKSNISIEEDSAVSYKLVIKNESIFPSTNNLITSTLPQGVEYVEGSASDFGEYDSKTRTITWNINLIDSEEEITLSYDVTVTYEDNTHYDFLTTVSNNENEEVQKVKNTITTEGVDNPKTGDIRQLIILSLLIISLVSLYIIVHKKQTIQSL